MHQAQIREQRGVYSAPAQAEMLVVRQITAREELEGEPPAVRAVQVLVVRRAAVAVAQAV